MIGEEEEEESFLKGGGKTWAFDIYGCKEALDVSSALH